MKNQQATAAMASFLLTMFFIKIRFIHSTTAENQRHIDHQILNNEEGKLSLISDIFIVYNGKQLVNNSVIQVPEGETVTLMCAENKRTTPENNKGSSSQDSSSQSSSYANIIKSDNTEYYGWYSDGVMISNTQTLTLPNAYLDTLPSLLTCAIHGPPSSSINQYKSENTPDYFKNDISISKENIIQQTNVNLEILSPPSFTIRRIPAFGIPIVEGMTVKLSCDIEIDQPSIPSSSPSNKNKKIVPKWMKNEVPVNDEDYGGRLKDADGAVTIMKMSMSDVGWYQCYTKVGGETYSSIGYFLNVKPAENFEDENYLNEDNANQNYNDDNDLGENFPKHDLGMIKENKLSSTATTERSHYQMVGENVVYEESAERKVTNDIMKGNFRDKHPFFVCKFGNLGGKIILLIVSKDFFYPLL